MSRSIIFAVCFGVAEEVFPFDFPLSNSGSECKVENGWKWLKSGSKFIRYFCWTELEANQKFYWSAIIINPTNKIFSRGLIIIQNFSKWNIFIFEKRTKRDMMKTNYSCSIHQFFFTIAVVSSSSSSESAASSTLVFPDLKCSAVILFATTEELSNHFASFSSRSLQKLIW